MNSDLDVYISRSLKNWAAKNQPPKIGRARLMQAVKGPPGRSNNLLQEFFEFLFSPILPVIRLEDEWLVDSVSQSRTWFAHIASSWRLSH